MKAAVFTQIGAPIEIQNVGKKDPAEGQVLIRILASGVCGTDIHVWNGLHPVQPPVVMGHEPVGVIEKTGPGVTGLKTGDRVGVAWFQSGCGRCGHCQRKQFKYCEKSVSWKQLGGGHAEFMIAEAEGCMLLPDTLPSDIAAPLFCAGFTVMGGYRNANPRPGERIAVLGIGGLGHLAIQIAKALGHEVIAVTGNADKRKDAMALGADDVLVVQDHAGRELAAMGGADIVLSTSTSMRHAGDIVMGLVAGGRLVIMGAGPETIHISPFSILLKQISIQGATQHDRKDLADVLSLAAQGKISPVLEHYRLNEINSVFARLNDGKVRFRAVIVNEP